MNKEELNKALNDALGLVSYIHYPLSASTNAQPVIRRINTEQDPDLLKLMMDTKDLIYVDFTMPQNQDKLIHFTLTQIPDMQLEIKFVSYPDVVGYKCMFNCENSHPVCSAIDYGETINEAIIKSAIKLFNFWAKGITEKQYKTLAQQIDWCR